MAKAGYADRRGRMGWVLFDVATQPVFTLVTTFVFAPYFANRLAASAVEGQSLWGLATGAAGLAIALLSPVLGAVADASGRRKPWIAAFSLMAMAGCLLLWRAAPGAEWAVTLALAGFILATVGAEFATVFTNAMMPGLVPPERLGRLSGLGWAAGYAGGLVALAIMLLFMSADPSTGRTIAGLTPLFGLDPASAEGDRASGPFSAIWYALFLLPLLLFTPDGERRAALVPAIKHGLSSLRTTLADLPAHKSVARYLLAHMVYVDGLVALFAFGGIYAAGVFGWGTIEIGMFGILLTVSGAIGAALGGMLDDLIGSKSLVLGALAVLFAASLGLISTDAGHVFFVIETADPLPNPELFGSIPERVYVMLGLVVGAVAGPLQSASRTLMARLSPPDRLTQFFGLYALSGKVTSFLGPTVVAILTAWTQSQRAGMAALLVFFVVGGILLAGVRPPDRAQRADEV